LIIYNVQLSMKHKFNTTIRQSGQVEQSNNGIIK
jgi:hypothetical protein